MKYKHIPSALHNFGHSFVSLMNYWDGEYIDDILERFARTAPGYEVAIDFRTGALSPPEAASNEKLAASTRHWMDKLPDLFEKHGIDPGSVQDIHMRYRLTRKGKEVIVEAGDDRGKRHKVFVHGLPL